MNQKTNTAPARDYEVGYGKPPVHTRFKKGQSGNPSGRSRKQERAPLLDEAKELALKEAARIVSIREGGKVRRMPALQAVYRSQFASAIKGNGPAARAVIKMVQDVEGEYGSKAAALTDSWMEYKIDAQRRIEDHQRRGLPIDDIKPHPDDIMVDINASRVWFRGDIWPDDAAKIRELGLGGQAPEPASPANDDERLDPEPAVASVLLATVLNHLDYEAKDAVLEALDDARDALDPSLEEGRAAEAAQVNSPANAGPEERPVGDGQAERRGPLQLSEILKRLDPQYRGPLRRAYAKEKEAVARLLDGVPRPLPSYAGIPAEQAAGLIRMYPGERLNALARDVDNPRLSERLNERASSILQKRLADLSRLKADPTLPKTMRVEVENALRKFNE